ncbi:MAG: SDR family NAD(P)-dependent oxidoreductase, partial [Deltaproteobacteria bacterium]|nr:SDR family NAD(P)-dependent oxidoreductase [Deltaproteobacteria bacterium]
MLMTLPLPKSGKGHTAEPGRALQGRAAIVTGSTSGIGLGIARALAQAGADVMLNGFGVAAEIEKIRAGLAEEASVDVRYDGADMSKPEAISAMIDQANAAFGKVDILVNNAGIQFVSPLESFPTAKWDAILAINLSAAFHASRAVFADMKKRNWGRIINIASAHGLIDHGGNRLWLAHVGTVVAHVNRSFFRQTGADFFDFRGGAEAVQHHIGPMAAGPRIEPGVKSRELTMETNLLNRDGDDGAPSRGPADKKPVRAMAKPAHRQPAAGCKAVNLALQGGGAHGAFTWGVLDRLLEDERIVIEGISATSAGAMNATVTAYGISEGGRAGARQALINFWRRVSHAADLSPLQPTWLDRMMGNRSLDNSPAYLVMDMLTRLLSPYQLNPTNYNPLREVLSQVVDFDALRPHCCPVKLYLSATNVRTGKVKVFGNDEITADAVLASGCLPFLFQAVEIDGEAYWDGGYMGNPA